MNLELRHNWSFEEVKTIFEQPFKDLLYRAFTIHRFVFERDLMQTSTLLSIKTGGCPEDCAYCPQSAHYNTEVKKESLLDVEEIIHHARNAKSQGASRFCMGGAWRSPPKKIFTKILDIIKAVKNLGLETCVTAGMLTLEEAREFKNAGLDYYNHNLDTSPEYYPSIIKTRTYQGRLNTLKAVREAGIKVCSGGILGLGESREDRIEFLRQLAILPKHPESVPINRLVSVLGTPLAEMPVIDNLEFVRCIATARILMPRSIVRLSAGRDSMSDELQTICFLAGANSIFYGEKLLTTINPKKKRDDSLLKKLGIQKVNL